MWAVVEKSIKIHGKQKKIGENTPYHTSTKTHRCNKAKTLTIELQHIDFTKRYSVTVLQLDSKGYSKQVLLYIFKFRKFLTCSFMVVKGSKKK